MEPMTGYDLLREVRASPELSQTPFIMITAESKTENVIAAKKAGRQQLHRQPFNAATLKTKMEAVFPGRPAEAIAPPPPTPADRKGLQSRAATGGGAVPCRARRRQIPSRHFQSKGFPLHSVFLRDTIFTRKSEAGS